MDDKLLERFTAGKRADPHAASAAGDEELDSQEMGCFGVLRGTKERAVSLELRQRDGSIKAISYAWIERFEYDPLDGITLFAAGWEITIAGRNLNLEVRPNVRLFESLARHRVPWLREADNAEELEAPKQATVIESISCKARTR